MSLSSFIRTGTLALTAAAAACAPANGPSQGTPGSTSALRAGLSVRASAVGTSGNQVSNLDHIFLSVSGVTAHAAGGGGWQTVSETPVVVDLLALQDSTDELGFAALPQGKITQIRLYVADAPESYVVTKDGTEIPLTVPSGSQSGVKLKGPFELGECEYGSLTAVVDVEKSILVHGHGNHSDMMMRPVIHRVDYAAVPAEECGPGGELDPGDPTEGDPNDGDPTDPIDPNDGDPTEGGPSEVDGDPEIGDDANPSDPADGPVDGNDPVGGETGGDAGGDGTDPADECAPEFVEGVGLVFPCP
jgi:hypothetical protein